MIQPGARFQVRRLPLCRIVVTMCEPRHLERIGQYADRLRACPDQDVLIHVAPDGCGFYRVLDGHHRYLASIVAGRETVLALVISEPGEPDHELACKQTTWQDPDTDED